MKMRLTPFVLLASAAFGQTPSRLVDYALVLEDAPVARKVGVPRRAPWRRGAGPASADSQRAERRARGAGAPQGESDFHRADAGERRFCDGHPRRSRATGRHAGGGPRGSPAALQAGPRQSGGPGEHPGGRRPQRRSRHQDRDHRFGNRPESPGISGFLANIAGGLSGVRRSRQLRLHQQQSDCGAQLRGAGCGGIRYPGRLLAARPHGPRNSHRHDCGGRAEHRAAGHHPGRRAQGVPR